MEKCSNCGKTIWFFNKFYRQYGKAGIYNIESSLLIKKVIFCSEKCCVEYFNRFPIINKKGEEQGK